MKHLEAGRHTFKPERITLTDIAIDAYSKTLEKMFTSARFPELDKTAQPVFYDPNMYRPAEPFGWARKPPRKCTRYTPKQREFLIEKFDSGVGGQRADYKQTALEMQNPSNAFSSEEFLTGQQIRSFWSRLAQQRKNNPIRDKTTNSNERHRFTRDTEDEVIIDDAGNEAYVEICDVELGDFDILEIDPEFYVMDFLKNTDFFEE